MLFHYTPFPRPEHAMKTVKINESDAVFRCLVVKMPRPTEATRLL